MNAGRLIKSIDNILAGFNTVIAHALALLANGLFSEENLAFDEGQKK